MEKSIKKSKEKYAHSLKNLEQISDEIHFSRQEDKAGARHMGARESGEGSEDPVSCVEGHTQQSKTSENVVQSASKLRGIGNIFVAY